MPMRIVNLLLVMALGAATSMAAGSATVDPALAAAIASDQRTAAFVARDGARHPAEELTFFGLKADANVIELWPGGGYWTEILAPYLQARGHYTVALPPAGNAEDDTDVSHWRARIAAQAARFGTIHETTLGRDHFDIAPAGSADLILTFRNLHNWMNGGYAPQVLAACLRALKPGGVLGIEDHRGSKDKPQDAKAKSGYVRQDYAISLVKQAGFEFVGASEVDANPKDTTHWPDGVWTLPPTLSQGAKDRAKYVAVGEADNFVLKFRKPM
jgi:predicted methyltransferase